MLKNVDFRNKKIFALILILLLVLTGIISSIFYRQNVYAKDIETKDTFNEDIKIDEIEYSDAKKIDIDEIILNNSKNNRYKEEIVVAEEELEYTTKYRNNNNLYIGTTAVSQEGRKGIQTITTKVCYDENGNEISREQVSAIVTKAALDKIIDIGIKQKIEVSGNNNLSFNIALNKKSGLSLEQFKKILTDSKDKNKVFEDNAQYFYYIEDQYNINGVFVASLGIHESGWGTSTIARKKYNLFGYGAYDSNPYNGAYTFENYSESIDLIARVLVKYYLNLKGTKIYDGETASGKYYNGNTLTAVNKKYATDKNWANAIYKHMKYLYDKI